MNIFKNQGYTAIILDTGINITTASELKINYRKPSGAKGSFTPAPVSRTKIKYQCQNADLDEVGTWRLQAYVVVDGLQAWGTVCIFEVSEILK